MDAVAQRWKQSLPPEQCMPKPSTSCRSPASKAFAKAEVAARLNYLEGICTRPTLPGQQAPPGVWCSQIRGFVITIPGNCLNLSSIPYSNSTDLIVLLFCSCYFWLLTTVYLSVCLFLWAVCMDCCLKVGSLLEIHPQSHQNRKWTDFLHHFATCPVG